MEQQNGAKNKNEHRTTAATIAICLIVNERLTRNCLPPEIPDCRPSIPDRSGIREALSENLPVGVRYQRLRR